MIYKIVNKPEVKIDLLEAIQYYKNINSDLAKQFLNRIKEAQFYLSENPDSFQIKYKNVRTLYLRQFPYTIHFIIESPKKQIVILAIIHSYRNPKDYSLR